MHVGLEADDATLAADEHLPRREDELEPQHDPVGPRLGADERDAGAAQRLDLVLEELVLGGIRARDANRERRRRGARIGSHVKEDTRLA